MKKGILLITAIIIFSVGVSAQKYGHADAQSMLTELPDYRLAEDSLKRFAAQLEAEMESQIKIYQQRVADFEKAKAAGLFSPEIEQSRIQELQEKQQRMQDYQVNAQNLIQQRETELLEPMIKRVKDAIEKVATDNKYTYIFDPNILLFSAGGDDIAPLVKKELGIQ